MNKEFKKVPAKLIGEDGNVFNLIGICTKALKRAGYNDEAKELVNRVTSCKSYEDALCVMTEYVDPYGEDYDYVEYDELDDDINFDI